MLDGTKTNNPGHSYRKIPTFGRDTIRKFSDNVSALTKLAARDFEDLLQVRFFFFLLFLELSIGLIPLVFNPSVRVSPS